MEEKIQLTTEDSEFLFYLLEAYKIKLLHGKDDFIKNFGYSFYESHYNSIMDLINKLKN